MAYEFKHYGRINANASFYTKIALNNFFEATQANEEYQSHPEKYISYIEKDLFLNDGTIIENAEVVSPNPELDLAKQIVKEKCLIAIVFSHLALEAFIYDFGAIQLGDTFIKEHLDKLDTYSKWVVIPQLVAEKSVDKSQYCFFLLKNLIKARNSIVHSKSKQHNFEKLEDMKVDTEEDFLKYAHNAILTIYELSKYLQFLTNDKHIGFHFLIDGFPANELWERFIKNY